MRLQQTAAQVHYGQQAITCGTRRQWHKENIIDTGIRSDGMSRAWLRVLSQKLVEKISCPRMGLRRHREAPLGAHQGSIRIVGEHQGDIAGRHSAGWR